MVAMCAACRALEHAFAVRVLNADPKPIKFDGKTLDPVADPTHTRALRAAYVADMTARFKALEKVIVQSVVKNDVFGLRTRTNLQKLTPLPPKAFADRTDAGRVKGFDRWLKSQEKRGILERVPAPGGKGTEPWQSGFIRRATAGGVKQANVQVTKLIGAEVGPLSSKDILGLLKQGAPLERVQLAYAQSFEALAGITAEMNSQISTALALGLAEGQAPVAIAKAILDRTSKIGITRAQMLARTETVLAHNRGALLEHDRAGEIIGEEVMSQWQTTLDGRARARHMARHGKVFRQDDALVLIGEPNCVLGSTMVQAPRGMDRVFERHYEGVIVTIRTARGNELACTPNHPVLTERGVVPAHSLNKGDNVLGSPFARGGASTEQKKDLVVAPIAELAKTWRERAHSLSIRTRPEHFHGDGEGSEVCVVYSDWELMRELDAARAQQIGSSLFARPNLGFEPLANSAAALSLRAVLLAASRFMRSGNLLGSFVGRHLRPLQKLSLVPATHGYPMSPEYEVDGAALNAEPVCKRFAGLASAISRADDIMVNSVDGPEPQMSPASTGDALVDGLDGHAEMLGKLRRWPMFEEVFADNIVSVERNTFSGHVYNLQSVDGLYISNGVISKNCRCALLPWIPSVQGKTKPRSAGEFKE